MRLRFPKLIWEIKRNQWKIACISFILILIMINCNHNLERRNNQFEYAEWNQNSKGSLFGTSSKQKVLDVTANSLNPIYIDNEGDFSSAGFFGSGTQTDPYLLTNFTIIASTDTLIYIEDTSAYFTIKNGTLNAITATQVGIYLENVTNGRIENNLIEKVTHGIHLRLSYNNTVANNTIKDCSNDGIQLTTRSSDNVLSLNAIYNCLWAGIRLGGQNNTLTGNSIGHCSTFGILVSCSSFNSLSDNRIYNCSYDGIAVHFGINNTFTGNIIYDSLNSGIAMSNGNNNSKLMYNRIFNCSNNGIRLDSNCNFNQLRGNTVYNCSWEAVALRASCQNNTLAENTLFNCTYDGIEIASSSNNTVSFNLVYNNTYSGFIVYGTSENNSVHWNNFIDNNAVEISQAYDAGINNNISFNYWGVPDDPYPINGGSNQDLYPLMNPVPPMITIITPQPHSYGINTIIVRLIGTGFSYSYYIEGVDQSNETWTANENRLLDDGSYTLHAYAEIFGTITHAVVMFTVDTVAPSISITSPLSTTYSQDSVVLVYTVSDGAVTIYTDDVANTTALPSGTVISDLSEGTHTITISAQDQTGNIGIETAIFNIDTIPSTTSTSNTDSATSTSTNTTTMTTETPFIVTTSSAPQPTISDPIPILTPGFNLSMSLLMLFIVIIFLKKRDRKRKFFND